MFELYCMFLTLNDTLHFPAKTICSFLKSLINRWGTGAMDEKGHFQKGESGNPKGRPKLGEAITDLFREYLEGRDDDNPLTRKRLLVEELYSRAMGKQGTDKEGKPINLTGSDELLKYIVNRLDGMHQNVCFS